MKSYYFKKILLNSGWEDDVTVQTAADGSILAFEKGERPGAEVLNVAAIPAFQNAHSHAFQYAMAGLAEVHSTTSTPDDFWSWREAMYKLALSISPDDLQVIAKQLYAEMLRHGYTDVAEFHYVHHDQDGKTYSNLSEMGERLVAAASEVGIGITLVPIFYQKGGFGKPPVDGQKRFISETIEDYKKLLEASAKSCSHYAEANVAIGIHSMRGVDPPAIAEVAQSFDATIPFHIHISEQLKEIEDSLAYLGKRPVEWMLDNVELNERFHLVHATHLTDDETRALANSKANVVICPSTEGNLGDGIFPLRSFQEYGGQWSIGTDSHVGLNPLEELRLLDYGQRLISHKRNTYYNKDQGDGGLFAIDMALKAGRRAMNNFDTEYFKVGSKLDAVLLEMSHPLLQTSSSKFLTSSIVYSADSRMQYGTISKGKLLVKEGKHVSESGIAQEFNQMIMKLGTRS